MRYIEIVSAEHRLQFGVPKSILLEMRLRVSAPQRSCSAVTTTHYGFTTLYGVQYGVHLPDLRLHMDFCSTRYGNRLS